MHSARFTSAPLTLAAAFTVALTVGSSPLALAQTSATAATAPVSLNIPAQPLGQALNALARQANLQMTFPAALVAGKQAPAVSGQMTVRQALDRLLAGSGLTASLQGSAVMIQQTPTPVAAPAQTEATLPAVTVRGEVYKAGPIGPDYGYAAQRSATSTKTDTPLIETPQSVSVVTRELIEDRAARSLGEALETVAGVSKRENYYFADDPYIRGFYVDERSGYLRDGQRFFNRFAIDADLLERAEVIKGPSSVIYGSLEPGGMVNLVSKRPLAEPLFHVRQDVGSWQDYKTTLDWSMPFEGGGGIRIPVSYRNNESFRDFVDGRSLQIAPAVEWQLAPATKLAYLGLYTDQKRTNDNVKIPVLNGKPVDIPRSRFLGDPGLDESVRAASHTLTLDHAFSPTLSYRGAINHFDVKEDVPRVISFFGFLDADFDGVPDDGRTLTRFASTAGAQTARGWSMQHELLWRTESLGMRHTVLAGLDYREVVQTILSRFGTYPDIDIYTPVYDNTFTPFTTRTSRGDLEEQLLGLYLQDQITLRENAPGAYKLELLLGLRADRARTNSVREGSFDPDTVASGSSRESALSPRLGLLWMPVPRWSVYASYATSFAPQSVYTLDSALAEPTEGKQFEVGVKHELRPGLLATASVFDLRRTNVPNTDALGFSVLSGEERSRGVELELTGELAPGWQVAFAYTHLDAFVSKSNNGDEGNQIGGTARNTTSLWLSKNMPSGFGGGIGVRHSGRVFANNANTFSVDPYTVVDASVWYRPNGSLGKGLSVGLTIKNLLDREYFTTANGFGTSVSPGTPRSFLLSVGYGF